VRSRRRYRTRLERSATSALWVGYSHLASIAGALSFANIFKDALALRELFRNLLDAWIAVIHPIADFLFGWIALLWHWLRIPIPLPAEHKDYLIIGVVVCAAMVRAALLGNRQAQFMPELVEHAYSQLRAGRTATIDKITDEIAEIDASLAYEIDKKAQFDLKGAFREASVPRRDYEKERHYREFHGVEIPIADSEATFEDWARAFWDRHEQRALEQASALSTGSRELLWLALGGFPIWPIAFVVSLRTVSDDTPLDLVDYLLNASLFLVYFCVLVLVNYAWFFV